MSAQVTISQLPAAGTITGAESVPIVQNGVTVRTTTGAIAAAPSQTQTFLTVNQETTLPNSRYVGVTNGLSITDAGAQGLFNISTTGALLSLVNSGTGFQVKTNSTTLVNRSIAITGAGLGITNGDGIAGNPTISLNGQVANLANASFNGFMVLTTAGAITSTTLVGTANQIGITNTNGVGNPVFSIADNPVFPGAGSMTIPTGTTAQQPGSPVVGMMRYDTTAGAYYGYSAGAWRQFSLSGGVTEVDTGTGLTGGPITGIGTISIANTTVTAGSYGSSTQVGTFTVNAQGQLTAAANVAISAASIGAVTTINGTANEITATGASTVTLSLPNALTFTGKTITGGAFTSGSINSTPIGATTPSTGSFSSLNVAGDTVVTLNATQTLTNKTYANPLMTGAVKLTATGAGAYTPFAQTFNSAVSNFNGYQLNYIQNTNNGSDASVDYVAYNDASDVDSYFIDMGISSSNYTNATYTIFPPNGAYVYTGGGTSGQASALLLGTSNAASDITLFTGGTLLANTRATIKGNTGNILINTTTDTGYKLNVNGTTYFGGASTFGSTVLLNADPTLSLQAATKQYVDAAVSTGFTVHPSVVYATAAALPTNTYNNGASGVGATLTAVVNGALSVDGNAVTLAQRILVKNEVLQANNGAYTVTQTGSAILPYILTRATDFDVAGAGEIANNAYFFVTAGATNAGSSFILSQTAAITVGTTALPFTLFNDQLDYVGGTNINITGLTISLTGTVAATNGGTGTNTVTTGDLLYGSGTNTWSKLPLGIGYKSLMVNASGTQVEWNAVPLNQSTAVSGQLGVSNGGTALSSYTTGDTIYASGATTLAKLGIGTSTYVMTSSGSAPQWTNPTSITVGSATNATNATNTGITANSANATNYLTFVSATSGNLPELVNSSITCNPSTGALTGGISGGTF